LPKPHVAPLRDVWFKVLSFSHALVQAAQSVGIIVQILGGDTQITFGRCLDLTALRKAFLGSVHVLVGILYLILQ
jgi:hypothetical protein